MSEPASEIEEEQRALAAHGGDARAAIEMLLLVNDARARSILWAMFAALMPEDG